MPQFSANLGLLWADLPLPDAIRAARQYGFDAIETQWPYHADPTDVRVALRETGLEMLSINTSKGVGEVGEFGLAAIPERGAQSVRDAFSYADAISARAVHVLPGICEGTKAWATFEENLRLACDLAGGRTVLIEPINPHDVSGYLLHSLTEAVELIEKIDHPRLKLMFDFYHIGRMDPDPIDRFHDVFPLIGHIQFASIPDRGAPDHGALNFEEVFAAVDASGWASPIGAEYRPVGKTEASLGWMTPYSS